MKQILLSTLSIGMVVGMLQTAKAQTFVANQNPNYQISRDKYMQMADSINTWHSTTPQETYKAIDYLEDKKIAKENRRAFRRELRLERASNNRWAYRNYYSPYLGYRSSYYNRSWSLWPWWY